MSHWRSSPLLSPIFILFIFFSHAERILCLVVGTNECRTPRVSNSDFYLTCFRRISQRFPFSPIRGPELRCEGRRDSEGLEIVNSDAPNIQLKKLLARIEGHGGFKVSSGAIEFAEMGSSDEGKSSKPDKSSSSPAREQQNNTHAYPDWAAMQAYYGPRVAMPPYFNSAVANGHPPPYMWGAPQMMMPPYGAPYAAIYPTGGVYAHPAVPYGPQQPGQGVPSSGAPNVTTSLSMDTPAKSSGDADKGLMKKLKSFDGLAMSIGNGNSDKAGVSAENRSSQSSESEGSSVRSSQSTKRAGDRGRKRSREGTSQSGSEKVESKPTGKVLGFPVTNANGGGEVVGTVLAPPNLATTLELTNSGVNTKTNPAAVVAPNSVVSSEAWPNERDMKRERRKQSNRESARRSRLRKQAEAEELGRRVESLTAENTTLRAEMNQLVEKSKKLRQENAMLMEKVKGVQPGHPERTSSSKLGINTENLLSRINSSSSGNTEEGGDTYDKGGSNSRARLQQLLDSNRRADAVAAG